MTEGSIKVGGGLVFWSISEWTDLGKLKEGLEAAGFDKYVPSPRPESAALKDALEEVFAGPGWEISRLKNSNAFEVVRLEKQPYPNPNQRTVEMLTQIGADRSIEFSKLDSTADAVVDSFNRHVGLVRAGSVTASLVSIMGALGGTPLRQRGGVYWLPPHRLDEWRRAAMAVESAGVGRPNACYLITHMMDGDAIRAVRDAIMAEVEAEARRINTDIDSGELGQRALERRQFEAEELRNKVILYEEMLGIGLTSLRQTIDETDIALGKATLLISATEELAHA